MEDTKKQNNLNFSDNFDEYDFDDILNDNLNINQEIDIKENPKKYLAEAKKQQLFYGIEDKKQLSSKVLPIARKLSKKKKITSDDIFLGDEVLKARSKTFPVYKYKNKFIIKFLMEQEKQNKNVNLPEDDDDYYECIRFNSFSYNKNMGEIHHLKNLTTNQSKKVNNKFKDNGRESTYVDEDEKKNENIYFIENQKELNNMSYYSKKNKCNYSFISLDLFIKKLCLENLRTNFPILYKSFINQYHEIFSVPILVEKIIDAFNYYNNRIKIEVPDLILLLNHIVSYQFKNIQNDESIIQKLKNTYSQIENLSWIDDKLRKEIENVDFILSNDATENNDYDVDYTKFLVSEKKRTRAIQIRKTGRARPLTNIGKNNKKFPYFYIFDFSNEEIAKNLTLISYKLLAKIDMNELWNCNFSKENKNIKAPNIMKIIDRFDKLVLFIIEDICSYNDPKIRANAITKLAEIADKCRELHNFNDLLIINNCLNHSCLKKLIKSWKKLPKKTLMLIDDLNKFCTNQQCYINIRKAIVNCKHLAYIPYLGILLEELVDIEKKYDYFLSGKYFNCIKLQKTYFAVTKFFEFKNYSFTFTQLNDLNILNNLNPKSEEEIEDLINQIEPKNKIKTPLPSGYKKRPTQSDEKFY